MALAAASLVIAFLLLPVRGNCGGAWAPVQRAFLGAQLGAHLAAAGTVMAEKAGAALARAHPPHLRVFWIGELDISLCEIKRLLDAAPTPQCLHM